MAADNFFNYYTTAKADSHTDLGFFLQNKQHFIVVYDIFKDGVAHFVKTSCTAQYMLGVLFLSNHKRPRATRESSNHSSFYIPFYILFDKHAYLVMASEGKRQVLSCGLMQHALEMQPCWTPSRQCSVLSKNTALSRQPSQSRSQSYTFSLRSEMWRHCGQGHSLPTS